MACKNVVIVTRELVPFYYGGIGTQFKALAQLLVDEGHRVTILSQKPDDFNETVFQEHYPDVVLHFVDCDRVTSGPDYSPTGGLISTFHYTYSQAVDKAFNDLRASIPVDFVVCADFGAEGFFFLKKKIAGFYKAVRFVLFIEGSLFDTLTTYQGQDSGKFQSELLDPQNRLNCALEDACIHMADDLIVPTELTWQQTKERLNLTRSADIIANIADDRLFDPGLEHGVDKQSSRTALFVGRLDRHKGADILLSAFIDIYGERPEEAPELLFVGRNTFNKQYQTTFIEYWQDRIPQALVSRIVFLGQVPHNEVVNYFKRATVSIFPSRWEVFGIVCLEAMSYGCPVIVSKGTGLEEVIGDDLSDYAIDFQKQQAKLAELFDTFFHVSEWDSQPLRKQVQARASFLVEDAHHRFKDFFSQEPIALSTEQTAVSRQLALLMGEISVALVDVLNVLSNDFLRLSDWSGLSEQEMKQVLTSESHKVMGQVQDTETLTSVILNKIKTAFGR